MPIKRQVEPVPPANGGMLDRKFDDLVDFVFVDAALYCRNERDVQADSASRSSARIFSSENVRLPSERPHSASTMQRINGSAGLGWESKSEGECLHAPLREVQALLGLLRTFLQMRVPTMLRATCRVSLVRLGGLRIPPRRSNSKMQSLELLGTRYQRLRLPRTDGEGWASFVKSALVVLRGTR